VSVAQGFACVQLPESEPLDSTNTAELASAHVPLDSRQIPLAQSLSAIQPRQLFALPSHTGASAVVHIASVTHATHAPLAAQYGVLLVPAQSASLPHPATQTWFSQNGADVEQSASLPHIATQKPFSHDGIDGSVQSVDVVHCGATHVPVVSQTSVPSHGVTPGRPKLAH
jgi:hypothetical protein